MREEERFTEYVRHYNPEDPLIRLKIIHTWKVVEAADAIAASLDLTQREKELVHLAALFHDIGRFEQARRFHTFIDAQSISHARLGAEILEQEDFLEDLEPRERDQVIKAVRVHSDYRIPDEDQGFQRILDAIIRDADKIDIFRCAVTENPDVMSCQSQAGIAQESISPEVAQAILSGQSVKRTDRHTALDYWVSYLGFIFDLNTEKAKELILEAGYWDQKLESLLDQNVLENPETRKTLQQLLDHTRRTLESTEETAQK